MDLQKLVNQKKVTIIDVRESLETFFGVADGALKIPLSKIKNKVDKFREMDTPIIVYCRSGNRSEKAKNYLKAQGISEVYNGGSLSDVKTLLKNKA